MGFINRVLFGASPNMICTEQPLKVIYALETLTHMLNQNRDEEDELTKDDVITYALDEYLKKNLWATPKETASHTVIKRATSFDDTGSGRVQRKTTK